jgi:uncharacterized protein YcsI (UPF0317 family)
MAADAIRAVQISTRFPSVHGAPIHFGDPSLIGISDINQPGFGDAVTIKPDEIPVFLGLWCHTSGSLGTGQASSLYHP